MGKVLIKNAKIVNEGVIFEGDVFIDGEYIVEIEENISPKSGDCLVVDAEGTFLLPGIIDDQVHFREPGLTYKGDIESESRAAVAGGITSFIEQPNTKKCCWSKNIFRIFYWKYACGQPSNTRKYFCKYQNIDCRSLRR